MNLILISRLPNSFCSFTHHYKIYLAALQKDITAFDKAIGTVSVMFLLIEMVAGPLALLRLLYAQAERYYLEEKQVAKELERKDQQQ